VLEFLSDDWLAALGEALACLPAGAGEVPDDMTLALGQIVTGVPGRSRGELHYTIVLNGPEGDQLVIGTTDKADVVLVTAYADAVALVLGASTAADLLELGKVKIRGDAVRIADSAALVERAAAASAELKERTTVA
jgi:hypothetical protein